MVRDTGFPIADAENDFLRVRRRQVLSRLASWLRHGPDDVDVMLPFDEVVAALGRGGARRNGLDMISLDSVPASVDPTQEFERRVRAPAGRGGERWAPRGVARTGERVGDPVSDLRS